MLEFLLLITQLCGDARSPSGRHYTPSLVKVAEPTWSHATERETAATDDGIWAAPEPTIAKDGIPPSPAILNAQGWKSVAELLGLLSGNDQPQVQTALITEKDPTDLSPVTDEIADLLAGWEKASIVKEATGFKFDRRRYDLMRNVETRSSGSLFYQSDNQGRFTFRDNAEPATKSERKDSVGNSLSIEPSSTEIWIWDQWELLHINRSDGTYSVAPLPREFGTKSNSQFRKWLMELAPFAIDIDREAIRREWSFNVARREHSMIVLEAIPRTTLRKQQFHKCLIRIDPHTYRVSAIKYVDASQKLETVYVLRAMSRTSHASIEGGFDPDRNLKGFRLVPMKGGR